MKGRKKESLFQGRQHTEDGEVLLYNQRFLNHSRIEEYHSHQNKKDKL